jgi:hypothetical protein
MARSFGDWCLERKPRREDSGQSSAIRGQLSKAWKNFREIFQALEKFPRDIVWHAARPPMPGKTAASPSNPWEAA